MSEPHRDGEGADDNSARPQRFFISYSRRGQDDGALAEHLRGGLERAEHEVFIDTEIPVGTDWGKEIARRIASPAIPHPVAKSAMSLIAWCSSTPANSPYRLFSHTNTTGSFSTAAMLPASCIDPSAAAVERL